MQFAGQVARLGGDCGLTQFKRRSVRDARDRGAGINAVASDRATHHKARRAVAGHFGVGVSDSHASQGAGKTLSEGGVCPPVSEGFPVLVN